MTPIRPGTKASGSSAAKALESSGAGQQWCWTAVVLEVVAQQRSNAVMQCNHMVQLSSEVEQ